VKQIATISKILAIVASVVLAAMMLLTVTDVTLRWLLNYPIIGATEITESMMTCIVFFALAWCAAEKSHLKVDLVVDRFSPRMQSIIDSLTTLAGLCLIALIAYQSFLEGRAVQEMNLISSLIKLPAYPFYYMIAAGCVMLCLVMIGQLSHHLGTAVRK
jgi:TRAP-type C4-dicarboxylate transport system permease small subunit